MSTPPRRLVTSVLGTVAYIGLAGCAPASHSPKQSQLPTGRETARATEEAVRASRDAGRTGLTYASNFDASEASEQPPSQASPDAGSVAPKRDASRSEGSPDAGVAPSRPDGTTKSPDTRAQATRTLRVTVRADEWRADDGSSFRELDAFQKWWTGFRDDARFKLVLRLATDITPAALGRTVEIAREGGADSVEIRFEGGHVTPSGLGADRAGGHDESETSSSSDEETDAPPAFAF